MKNSYAPKYDEKNYKEEAFPLEKLTSIDEFEIVLKNIKDNFNNNNVVSAQEIINASSEKNGIKTLFRKTFGEIETTKGVYVYAEKLDNNGFRPIYVGISKSIVERKRQHLVRTDKGTATLALKIARHVGHISDEEENKERVTGAIKTVQDEYLKNLWITIHPYPDTSNFLLPMLEIYLAIKLKTYWNTFETH